MPVISVATQSELLEKMVSNIVEVKSRDAFTITVTKQGTEFSEGVMDEVIENTCFRRYSNAISNRNPTSVNCILYNSIKRLKCR